MISPELLKKIQERDKETLTALVEEHTLMIVRAAHGLGFDAETVKELAQRVWVTFFEIAPRYEGRSQVSTFLYGILYNRAREYRRHQQRPDSPDPVDHMIDQQFDQEGHWVGSPVDPEKFASAAQTRTLIQDCLDKLPLPQRLAFWLREVDGAGTEEIREALSVSLSNVGVLLHRARHRLRICLEGKV